MTADVNPDDLRRIRMDNDLSFKEMAEILGIAEVTLRQYESGIRIPSTELLTKISKEFCIDFRISAKNIHPLIEKKWQSEDEDKS